MTNPTHTSALPRAVPYAAATPAVPYAAATRAVPYAAATRAVYLLTARDRADAFLYAQVFAKTTRGYPY